MCKIGNPLWRFRTKKMKLKFGKKFNPMKLNCLPVVAQVGEMGSRVWGGIGCPHLIFMAGSFYPRVFFSDPLV
jgi:hypothetical protein